jgi:hypothetical protein
MEEINDTAFANQLGRTNVEGERLKLYTTLYCSLLPKIHQPPITFKNTNSMLLVGPRCLSSH